MKYILTNITNSFVASLLFAVLWLVANCPTDCLMYGCIGATLYMIYWRARDAEWNVKLIRTVVSLPINLLVMWSIASLWHD